MQNNPPHLRLPRWSPIVIAAGCCLAYIGAGELLIGMRFLHDLPGFLQDPQAFTAGDPEMYAPFVLLLIPAVFGGIATRSLLRIVLGGIRDGESMPVIAKAVIGFLLSALLLVIAALFTGPNVRR